MFARVKEYIEAVALGAYMRHIMPGVEESIRNLTIDTLAGALVAYMTPNINVTLDDGAKLPVRAHETDAGADLCCVEDVTVPAGDSVLVDTGVHIELPPHSVGMLKSKSGLNCMQAITTTGVIDEGYTGSIKVRVYNHGEYPKEFKAGDKVTQLVVVPVEYPTYEESESISGGERGDSGFGSTGA